MRADYDDPNYEAEPVNVTALPNWQVRLRAACIVGAIVTFYLSLVPH